MNEIERKIMKKISISLLLIVTIINLSAQVDFRRIESSEDMDKVWADALSQNKPVFVDIYATWCGPCKWLDANVFATEAAGEYMNREFINVKMDGETDFGRVFAMKSGLSAYPSLFLFNAEQKLMNMIVGAKPWEDLKPALASTLEYFPVLEVLQNKFESGVLKKEEYPRFSAALREMGKEDYGRVVAEKYQQNFNSGDEVSFEDIQVLAYYTPQESVIWDQFVEDIPKLKEALGIDFENFLDHTITLAIETAVEKNDISYIENLVKIVPDLCEGTSFDQIEVETRLYVYYYHYSEQIEELISYIDSEYKSKRTGDHNWLFTAASNAVFLDPQIRPVAEKGLEWFKTCIELEETQDYYYHLALCEYFTDSPEMAIASLKSSLNFTTDPEIIQTTNSIIEQVQGEIDQE